MCAIFHQSNFYEKNKAREENNASGQDGAEDRRGAGRRRCRGGLLLLREFKGEKSSTGRGEVGDRYKERGDTRGQAVREAGRGRAQGELGSYKTRKTAEGQKTKSLILETLPS